MRPGNVPWTTCSPDALPDPVTPLEQRVRHLLARRQALESLRPVRPDLLVADGLAEGLAAADVAEAVQGLLRQGLAMRVDGGWTLRPPPFPPDVTEALAGRMRLGDPHR